MNTNNTFYLSKNRYIDTNSYLYIKNNVLMREGVFEYLGSEIQNATDIELNPNQIYKVYRPLETLEQCYQSFANKPITLEHEWVDGQKTSNIVGNIGSNIRIENAAIICDLLTIVNKEAIELIYNGICDKLSAGFSQNILNDKGIFNDIEYDFKQYIIDINHLALCRIPRDSNLKVNDSKESLMKKTIKVFNNFLKIKGKKVFDSLEEETEAKVKEIISVAKKPDEEFENGRDEKIIQVLQLASELPFNYENVDYGDIEKEKEFELLEKINDDNVEEAYEILKKLNFESTNEALDSNDEDKEQTAEGSDSRLDDIKRDIEDLRNSLDKILDRLSMDKKQDDSEETDSEDKIDIESLKDDIKKDIIRDDKDFREAYEEVAEEIGEFNIYDNEGNRKTESEVFDYGLKILQAKYDFKVTKNLDSKSAFLAAKAALKINNKKTKKVTENKFNLNIPGVILKERD